MRVGVGAGLGQACTQAEFGELVGISQQAVSDLMQEGVLAREATAGEWLQAYCARLREVAAGRQSEGAGGLDLVQERAALARAQREAVEIKNAVLRRDYAPVELLSHVLGTAAQAVAERIDAVPAALKQRCPDLPAAARVAVEELLAAARNEWVSATASLVEAQLDVEPSVDDGDSDEWVEEGAAP